MKKLRLFGYDWTLVLNTEKGKYSGGSFDWKTKRITIDDRYGEYHAILLHEIIEAVLVRNLVRYYGNEGNQEYHFSFNHTQFTKIVDDIYQALSDNNLLNE